MILWKNKRKSRIRAGRCAWDLFPVRSRPAVGRTMRTEKPTSPNVIDTAFEFNNKYRPIFEKKGMDLVGICEERDLVEIIELQDHPWFVGVQFHPEFKSRPMEPHPLFPKFCCGGLETQRAGGR